MDNITHAFCQKHHLPQSFQQIVSQHYQPLAEKVFTQLSDAPYVLGINGAQGTGKSTLADFIAAYLHDKYQLRVACLSIDDLYLTRDERLTLSQSTHPLFATRGVPGTHDVSLGLSTIQALRALKAGESFAIPSFDKSTDDRRPTSEWSVITGPIDLIIFEGWCVGSEPVEPTSLATPINALEEMEDPDGTWRQHVNQSLTHEYPALFSQLDALIMLQAPDFDCVYRWRLEQEQKLAAKHAASESEKQASGIMSAEEVARFIQHYERITHANINDLSKKADVLIKLGQDHQVLSTDSHF